MWITTTETAVIRILVVYHLLLRAVTATTTTAPTSRLDLSFQHHLDTPTRVRYVQSFLTTTLRNKTRQPIHIDLSDSAVKDADLHNITNLILLSSNTNNDNNNSNNNNNNNLTTINLILRRNDFTIPAVTQFLQQIIKQTTTIKVETIDLGWNQLQNGQQPQDQALAQAVQQLVEHPSHCPTHIRLECCSLGPLFCRAMAQGIIHKYSQNIRAKPLTLHLASNPNIGDAGTAAFAAAIRTITTEQDYQHHDNGNTLLLEELDLSACDIGDAGAEAIAIALESAPYCCIRTLDLSQNPRLTDRGVTALVNALIAAESSTPVIQTLNLGSNTGIGDRGAEAIMKAVATGRLTSLSMRSCHIHADGCSALGTALRSVATAKQYPAEIIDIDLSGNPIGMLRGKSKAKGDKYSASRLKDKAAEAASTYMNLLKKGWKDVGLGGMSAESDDEEEKAMGEEESEDLEPSNQRCGAKALVAAFLGDNDYGDANYNKEEGVLKKHKRRVNLSLRHCFFDHGAADALAALVVEARKKYDLEITLDVKMNPILEEEMVGALHGDAVYRDRLNEMAERHMEGVEALKEAREKAQQATRLAKERFRASEQYEAQWDVPKGLGDDGVDSDADYEDEENASYY